MDLLRLRKVVHTIYLCTGMNDASTGVREHSMHASIFLTKMSLMMLAFLDIVYLHTTVAFRGKEKTTFIIETKRGHEALS